MPLWYWKPKKWGRLKADKSIVEASIIRLGTQLITESYPTCNIENWWLQ